MPGLPSQIPWRRFVCVLRKLGYTARKAKRGLVRSFVNQNRNPNVICRNPTPETTCARQCCVSIFVSFFVSFFSTRMSSCICWKTRSDAQTTPHGHLDRTCENTVRPMKHHRESPDEILFAANVPRMHQRRPRRKSSSPNELQDCPALD